MRKLTESETMEVLGWSQNYHEGPYLEHPQIVLRRVLDWESGYVCDVRTIAEFAVSAVVGREICLHWVANRGRCASTAFDVVISEGLDGVSFESWPVILEVGGDERDLLVGHLAYRMSVLADHTLIVPGGSCAVGFTNDGECFLYGDDSVQFDAVVSQFGCFADEFKEVSNDAGESIP